MPFLFKAFETGQARPPRPGTKAAEEPRASTIHEYLDWTVTAAEGGDADDDLVGPACACVQQSGSTVVDAVVCAA